MYKIYINNNPLFLVDEQYRNSFPKQNFKVLTYRKKIISMVVDQLEKSDDYQCIILYSKDLKGMKSDFFGYFKRLSAAGGVVVNDKKDLLMIYRHGCWDLPKGKIEKKEGKKEAAIREVQEETGLKQLMINTKIGATYHSYRLGNGQRILKKTHWYLMFSEDIDTEPQIEEGITRIDWIPPHCILPLRYPKYGTIRDVLQQAFPIIQPA